MWRRRGAKSQCSSVKGERLKSRGRKWKRREEVCFEEMKWMVPSEPLPKESHEVVRENEGAARIESTEGRKGVERNKSSRDERVSGGGGNGERVGVRRGGVEKRAHREEPEEQGREKGHKTPKFKTSE